MARTAVESTISPQAVLWRGEQSRWPPVRWLSAGDDAVETFSPVSCVPSRHRQTGSGTEEQSEEDHGCSRRTRVQRVTDIHGGASLKQKEEDSAAIHSFPNFF